MWSVVPGGSLSDFVIGMPLIEVATLLRNDAEMYQEVEVLCNDQMSPTQPITLRIMPQKITLSFDERTQCLQRVEIDDLGGEQVRYKGEMLCGPSYPPTFIRLYEVLGPTFLGDMDSETGMYTLKYPGLSLLFRIPSSCRAAFADGKAKEHPMRLADGTTPVAFRMIVEPSGDRTPPVKGPARSPRDTPFPSIGEAVELVINDGLTFKDSNRQINFGDCPQDIITLLGQPDSIFDKDDRRMQAARGDERSRDVPVPPYTYNYKKFGIDITFDGVLNEVEKITCYNSLPSHETFLLYQQCNFSCRIDGVEAQNQTLWEELEASVENIPEALIGSTQFGPVRIFPLNGVVVNVASTGRVASLMIFRPQLAAQP